jgi:hypothetical protein
MKKNQLFISLASGFLLTVLSTTSRAQKNPSAMQNDSLARQKNAAVKQQAIALEQFKNAAFQRDVMQLIKQEMLKDNIVKKNESYELLISRKAMIVNGTKLTDTVHGKYMKLITDKLNRPLNNNEEWKMKE